MTWATAALYFCKTVLGPEFSGNTTKTMAEAMNCCESANQVTKKCD